MMRHWDLRFLQLAGQVSTWSKDPSTKVGAVIVDGRKTVRGIGYNGLHRHIKDTSERLENRDLKYKLVIHAEVNAILNANGPLWNSTIYLWPFMPCSNCASAIINAGIGRVVSIENDNPRWRESFELTRQLFEEADVDLTLYPREDVAFNVVVSAA